MKKRSVLALIGVCCVCVLSAQNICTIKGIVKNRPQSKVLYLAPVNTDFRSNEYITVPIVDSCFNYSFLVDNPQCYSLIFEDEYLRGDWMDIRFIAESAQIDMVLNEENKWGENVLKGSVQTDRLKWYRDYPANLFNLHQLREKSDSMNSSGVMYSEAYKLLMDEIKQTKNNKLKVDSLFKMMAKIERYSEAGLELRKHYKLKSDQAREWEIAEISRVPDIVGLSYLQNLVYKAVYCNQKYFNMNDLREIYNTKYKSKFRDNPMSKNIELYLSSVSATGSTRYIDFSAPDLNGEYRNLSELIDGKVAILDLWASWCAPCMRTSMALIPVYEKYKDKGLVIVGVAREKGNSRAMISAVDRLKLPWVNLVELNDEQRIWNKYGVGNGGGKVFLINQNGEIVLNDITSSSIVELDSRLNEMLD